MPVPGCHYAFSFHSNYLNYSILKYNMISISSKTCLREACERLALSTMRHYTF